MINIGDFCYPQVRWVPRFIVGIRTFAQVLSVPTTFTSFTTLAFRPIFSLWQFLHLPILFRDINFLFVSYHCSVFLS